VPDDEDLRYHDDPVHLWEALADMLERPAWWADALFREKPSISWFPERGQDLTAAREVCSRCLVREECLAAGLGEDHGVWGGTSFRERKQIRRSCGAAA
jgi:WhiB family redox-sensing transcriptional regulator